jgi:hypothetical protein
MQLPTPLQGRPFGPEQLAQVQALIGQNRGWSRYRLSLGQPHSEPSQPPPPSGLASQIRPLALGLHRHLFPAESPLCLEVFWRNERWEMLFPHAKLIALANN